MSASHEHQERPARGGFRHPSALPQKIDPVAEYVRVLSAHPAVDRLILFGSRAIGDNWPRSDVDMAVVVNADGDGLWHEIQETAQKAWTLISIDLVRYDQAAGAFKDAIDNHGRVVFDRAKG